MVGVKCNHCIIFGCHFYRERLSELVCQVNLLSCFQFFRARELRNLNSKYSVRIRHAICLLRHQMNIHSLSDFHVSYRRVKSADHLSGSADELQRLAAVIRRIELGPVVECSPVMRAACFSHIAACQ